MMNSSSFPDVERHAAVRIDYSKARQKYAKGGLAKKAEDVRGAGRMGDDMVVHVNKREFDEMRQRWGDPTVNPHTGMPEFFLGDLFSGIGDVVTTGASYLPVVGESASSWLGDNPWAAQALGSGLLGAGAGQLLGGNTRSTLLGGALGALAPSVLGGLGLTGSTGSAAGGGGSAGTGAAESGAGQAGGSSGGALSGLSDSKKAMAGIIGALTVAQLVGGSRGPNAAQKQAQKQAKDAQDRFNAPLPAMTFNRAMNPYAGNPTQYGFGGGNGMGSWFTNNRLPQREVPVQGQYARGGHIEPYAGGGKVAGALSDIFEKVMQEAAARKERARALAESGAPVRMQNKSGHKALVQPDMSRGEGWRVTRFDEQGPQGHVEYPDPYDAIYNTLREGFDPVEKARGGHMGALGSAHVSGESPRYVQGPGGAREDKIPAMLSDGEYVIDRETLALLGDGSSEDGARKLDAMRENIRKHKGGALAQGKISPDAKPAERYLGGSV